MKERTNKARTQLWLGAIAATLVVSGAVISGCSNDLGTAPGQNAFDNGDTGTPESTIPVVDDGTGSGGVPEDIPADGSVAPVGGPKDPEYELPTGGGDGASLIEGLDLSTPTLLPEGSPDLVGGLLEGVVEAGHVITTVDSEDGGRLEHSIFSVDVPSGAVDASTQFELKVEENAGVRVSLFPEGLQFSRPVKLSMDLSEIVGFEGPGMTVYWWDPAEGEWVNIGGEWDNDTRTLSIELWHFSDYSAGRAGWKGGSGPKKPVRTESD